MSASGVPSGRAASLAFISAPLTSTSTSTLSPAPFRLSHRSSSASVLSPSSSSSFPLPPPVTHAVAHGKSHSSHRPPSEPMSAYFWWRVKRLTSRPLLWLIVLVVAFSLWQSSSRASRGQLSAPELQSRLKGIYRPEVTRDLQFYPASNHKIHYVGRWTTAPNKLRIDGAFPGVYFDLNITNTSSLVLSLQNSRSKAASPIKLPDGAPLGADIAPGSAQLPFATTSRLRVKAPPVSLLALVDQEEYVILPNASSLVVVRKQDLDPRRYHTIRVIAPMTDDDGSGIVQFDGLWLDKGGQLYPVEGSAADNAFEQMDSFDEDDSTIGNQYRLAISNLLKNPFNQDRKHADHPLPSGEEAFTLLQDFRRRKKLIEIVTDSPANLGGRPVKSRSGGANSLLTGVMGWEYLLGEMFQVDHVSIGARGMCLLQNCVGGTGFPNGLGDVFFRSGPTDSPHFGHPWAFQSYAPDVLVFNLGASDYHSIVEHASEYNVTAGQLVKSFEDTYVSLIKAVRSNAYPTHPAYLDMQRLGIDSFAESDSPASIPIFVMRPFGGELERATQGAVNRLRADGDHSVFWLDTSGWLNYEDTTSRDADFFKDSSTSRLHLTERGNQKISIYLHMHVCRYLADMTDNCAFLPPDVYQGRVFDPKAVEMERHIESQKEQEVKKLFWDQHGL